MKLFTLPDSRSRRVGQCRPCEFCEPFQRIEIAHKLKPHYAARAKKNLSAGGKAGGENKGCQKSDKAVDTPIDVKKELARHAKVSHDDADTLRMFEEACTGKHGTNQYTKVDSDNVTIQPTRGNTRAYTLRRLAKDRPDLYAKVVAKEMTANAAAIEAGIRKVKTPMERVMALLPLLSPADLEQLHEMTRYDAPGAFERFGISTHDHDRGRRVTVR